MKMKNSIKILLLIAVLILATSCAHVQPDINCLTGKIYGFWNGLWHGMIAGITFIGSLFNHDIAVYAVNNNGAWYNFGFLLGVGGSCGGGVRYTSKRKRR
jgi:hypothetical protein